MKTLLALLILIPSLSFSVTQLGDSIEIEIETYEIKENVTMTKAKLICSSVNETSAVVGFKFNEKNTYKTYENDNIELGEVIFHYIDESYNKILTQRMFYKSTFDEIFFFENDSFVSYFFLIDRNAGTLKYLDEYFEKEKNLKNKVFICDKVNCSDDNCLSFEEAILNVHQPLLKALKKERRF